MRFRTSKCWLVQTCFYCYPTRPTYSYTPWKCAPVPSKVMQKRIISICSFHTPLGKRNSYQNYEAFTTQYSNLKYLNWKSKETHCKLHFHANMTFFKTPHFMIFRLKRWVALNILYQSLPCFYNFNNLKRQILKLFIVIVPISDFTDGTTLMKI